MLFEIYEFSPYEQFYGKNYVREWRDACIMFANSRPYERYVNSLMEEFFE
jgi:hypothetical protein